MWFKILVVICLVSLMGKMNRLNDHLKSIDLQVHGIKVDAAN